MTSKVGEYQKIEGCHKPEGKKKKSVSTVLDTTERLIKICNLLTDALEK